MFVAVAVVAVLQKVLSFHIVLAKHFQNSQLVDEVFGQEQVATYHTEVDGHMDHVDDVDVVHVHVDADVDVYVDEDEDEDDVEVEVDDVVHIADMAFFQIQVMEAYKETCGVKEL